MEVTFTIRAGGGKFSDGSTTTFKATTGGDGIASALLTLGQKTSANLTFWWEEGYTYAQQVGENIVEASLPSGVRTPKPFTAYGFPKDASQIKKVHGDGIQVPILSFAGFVSISIEDTYGNPISNLPVSFNVLSAIDQSECSNPNQDNRQAVLVNANDPCLKNSPTLGECSTQTSSLLEKTDSKGAVAQVILGSIPGARYPISATSGKFSATFNLYSESFGNCNGTEDPSIEFSIDYVYTADLYGNNVNAGKTGTEIPLQARIHFLKEGVTDREITIGCQEGPLTCTKRVGNRQYLRVMDFPSSWVRFGSQQGVAQQNGIFISKYTLQSGLNLINIQGKASTDYRWTEMSCPETCTPHEGIIERSALTTMRVYGVDIQVGPIPVILVDENGYTTKDNVITYTIAPAEYKAITAFVLVYKDGELIAQIPTELTGTGTATIARGFWFDINGTYETEVVLNYGTGVEIRSDKKPLKVINFKIIKPTKDQKILIKNNSSGDPQMEPLTAEVTLRGTGITPEMINNLEVCWITKVEYIVNITKPKAEHRSRKGLECDSNGVCKGKDGFLIPAADSDGKPVEDCKKATYEIPWSDNFGGGILQITARTTFEGIELSDTYLGSIQGQTIKENANFKQQIINYLEAPTGVGDYQTILSDLGYSKFFRVIGYMESDPWAGKYSHFERLSDNIWRDLGPILGHSSEVVFPVVNKSGTAKNPLSDGGYGLMQLTEPVPSYLQIWHYRKNIDRSVELIRSKLSEAKAYPELVRTTNCQLPPVYNPDGSIKYYRCKPQQPKDNTATAFSPYQLKMDTYSLYNSDWHYWKWEVQDLEKKWVPRLPQGNAPSGTGSRYADEAEEVEKNPPSSF